MSNKKKELRQQVALQNMQKRIDTGFRHLSLPHRIGPSLTKEEKDSIKYEMTVVSAAIGRKKKGRKKQTGEQGQEQTGDKYWIEIFSIHYSKIKHSDRRKNKGKSRKKLRVKKAKTFLKKVVLQPGLLQRYRDGVMGLSPKTHSFSIRRDEDLFNYNK